MGGRCAILIFALLLACTSDKVPTKTATTAPEPVIPSAPVESSPRLDPVDQAATEPSFLDFRNRLLAAIQRRDREFVLSVLHPKIRVSFGNGGGVEEFKQHWRFDEPDTPLWTELEQLLRLGGTFQTLDGQHLRFCAPYVYSAWPENGPDAFETLAVISGKAPLHRDPQGNSPVVALLDYVLVTIHKEDSIFRGERNPQWRRIVTSSGRDGWIESRYVRSPIDYRSCFAKSGDGWKMMLLVAGD